MIIEIRSNFIKPQLALSLMIIVFGTSLRADVVRTPISTGEFSGYMSSCLLQGGTRPPFTDHIPAMCCAVNEEGTRWCVTCFSGTSEDPRDCSVTTPGRVIPGGISRPQAPGGDVLAPTPDTPAPGTGLNIPLLQLQTTPLVMTPSN